MRIAVKTEPIPRMVKIQLYINCSLTRNQAQKWRKREKTTFSGKSNPKTFGILYFVVRDKFPRTK